MAISVPTPSAPSLEALAVATARGVAPLGRSAQVAAAVASFIGLLLSGSARHRLARPPGTVLGLTVGAILGRVAPSLHRHGSAHLPEGPGCLSPDSPGPHGVSPFLSLQADPRASSCTVTGQAITGTGMTTQMTLNDRAPLVTG